MPDHAIKTGDFSRKYPSKRDTWVVVLIWLCAGILLALSFAVGRLPVPLLVRLILLALYLGIASFGLWVVYTTDYVITETVIDVRSGPFKWKVPLDQIAQIVPSGSMLSSPACSLDRLHITYRTSRPGLLISPVEKERFLQDLAAVCPFLKLDGEKLVRR